MSTNKTKPADHVTEGAGKATIKLSRQATVNGTPVDSLTMREPTVGDQLRTDEEPGQPAAKEIKLFANLCSVSPADIEKLPLRDYQRLQAAYGLFID